MSMVTSNRLLPILVGSVLLLTVFVTVKSCSPEGGNAQLLDAVPQAPKPDADTPADTIKTLTANVSAMTAEVNALRRDNAVLQQDNQSLLKDRSTIEDNVLTRLQRVVEAKDSASEQLDNSTIAALTVRVDSLAQSLAASAKFSTESDIPVGLGLGGDGLDGVGTSDNWVWTEPLEKSTQPSDDSGNLLNRFGRSAQNGLALAKPHGEKLLDVGAKAVDSPTPVYTIPRNATLIGSTAMTALVGRVPVKGQVHDPMPFKVIAGKDNLAANGLMIPGLQGMIWSGTAIGDWTLSCVSGQLESVTFVFEDGTIQTLSSDDNSLSGSSGSSASGGRTSGQSDKPLGWISDARGIPCITGERKSNAPAFLSQRIGVSAMEAAANAAAQSETTTLLSDSGTVSNTVTGATGKYVLGKTLSGSSKEIARWLQERQAQSFDAVFVPAGIELAIHVDHELPIDFHAKGRKLHHANTYGFQTRTPSITGLD
ncbi:MAG: TIGR03752 family integrating conjugative element protein [Cellvibrionales bacterium]|nr:MAG: TIGR03752 family integrating conjugative element protein [Cellvibrionales bacterium]